VEDAMLSQSKARNGKRHEATSNRRHRLHLRQIEARLSLGRKLAEDLTDVSRLRTLLGFVNGHRLDAALQRMLDVAIEITKADFGNIQLLDPATGTLRIAVQRGFPKEFLSFFEQVHHNQAACGTALRSRSRVIVEDVTNSPVFRENQMIEILLGAGVRAVQSTPLISRAGQPLGMISTHYRNPGRPQERALRLLSVLARSVSDFVEWRCGNRAGNHWHAQK
jgi:hypothetical protein